MEQPNLKHEVEQLKGKLAKANKLLKHKNAGLNACMAKISELEETIADYKALPNRLSLAELDTLINIVFNRDRINIGLDSLVRKRLGVREGREAPKATDLGVRLCSNYIDIAHKVNPAFVRKDTSQTYKQKGE